MLIFHFNKRLINALIYSHSSRMRWCKVVCQWLTNCRRFIFSYSILNQTCLQDWLSGNKYLCVATLVKAGESDCFQRHIRGEYLLRCVCCVIDHFERLFRFLCNNLANIHVDRHLWLFIFKILLKYKKHIPNQTRERDGHSFL